MAEVGLDVSDDHLRSIGRVVVNFAVLEGFLSFVIRILMKTERDVGEIVTAQLSFAQRVTAASSLFMHRLNSAEKLTEWKELLVRVEQAGAKRNAVVHSVWILGETPDRARRLGTTAKRKDGLKFHYDQRTVAELDEDAYFIAKVTSDLEMFLVNNYEMMFK